MLEHLWLPHGVSTYSARIDFLFTLVFWITLVVLIAVTSAMVIFLVKYRARPGRKATYMEGNPRLEVLWTTATTAILIGLALLSRSTWANIKEQGPPGDAARGEHHLERPPMPEQNGHRQQRDHPPALRHFLPRHLPQRFPVAPN